ncbi:MAG: hypothetical protein WHS83_19085 [Chloroflexus sp.]|uniref:hypothetical protein n=1 Tax=Chloroflexus sp. TaxID=1904827 RepID=UPI00309B4A45
MWRSAGSGPVNPQDLNRYAYALNNPLTYTDPTGHHPWTLLVAGGPVGGTVAVSCLLFFAAVAAGGIIIGESIRHAATDGQGPRLPSFSTDTGGQPADPGGLEPNDFPPKPSGIDPRNSDDIPGIRDPTSRSQLRINLEKAGIRPPSSMANPQAHHNLPWKFREWFAGPGRGLNVNDPQFGRWVSGTPPGSHQRWTAVYEQEWAQFIRANPHATRQQVLAFLDELLKSGRFPSQ